MRMEDMPKYIEPNWDEILANVDWIEFDYMSRRFRAGQYKLDNGTFTSVELFLSKEAPTEDGWVGYRWCQTNGHDNDWPTADALSKVLKKTSAPTEEYSVGIDPVVKVDPEQDLKRAPQKAGRIIRPRVG